jgi:hypothetical protein
MLYLDRRNKATEGGLVMNKLSKLYFEGQQIYVGMDVHNKSWSISILIDKFEHKILTQPPEVGTFFELS